MLGNACDQKGCPHKQQGEQKQTPLKMEEITRTSVRILTKQKKSEAVFSVTDVPQKGPTDTDKKDAMVRVSIRTCDYDPFRTWMPFITWDGAFFESSPMQVRFTAPTSRKDDVIKILKAHGYRLI